MANKHTFNTRGLAPLCAGLNVMVLDDPTTKPSCRSARAAIAGGAKCVVALSSDPKIKKRKLGPKGVTVHGTSTEFLSKTRRRFNVVFLDYCRTPACNGEFDWREDVALLLSKCLRHKGMIFLTFSKRNMSNVATFVVNTLHQIDNARFVDMYEYRDTSNMVIFGVCRASDWGNGEEPPRVSSAFIPTLGETVEVSSDWCDGKVWTATFRGMRTNKIWEVEDVDGSTWSVYPHEVTRLVADEDDDSPSFPSHSYLTAEPDTPVRVSTLDAFPVGTRVRVDGEPSGPNEHDAPWPATVCRADEFTHGPTFLVQKKKNGETCEVMPHEMSCVPEKVGESLDVTDDPQRTALASGSPWPAVLVGGPFWFVKAADGNVYRTKATEMSVTQTKKKTKKTFYKKRAVARAKTPLRHHKAKRVAKKSEAVAGGGSMSILSAVYAWWNGDV